MILFSIICPTFNNCKILKDVINSITSQTFNDYELIIVDDGSTDGTIKFLSDFKNERIKFFQNEHSGPLLARVYGAKKACGRYLVFVDSDDLCSKNLLMYLNNIITLHNPDIITYNCVEGVLGEYPNFDDSELDTNVKIVSNKEYDFLLGPLWLKCIKRNIFLDSFIDIPKNLLACRYMEDFPIQCLSAIRSSVIVISNAKLYCYRRNKDSITKNLSYDDVIGAFRNVDFVVRQLLSNQLNIKHLINDSYAIIFKLFLISYKEHNLFKNKELKNVRKSDSFKILKLSKFKFKQKIFIFSVKYKLFVLISLYFKMLRMC